MIKENSKIALLCSFDNLNLKGPQKQNPDDKNLNLVWTFFSLQPIWKYIHLQTSHIFTHTRSQYCVALMDKSNK